jgi:drug/metabolite transporter (DMT)-like permease
MLKGVAAGFLAYVLFSSSDSTVKALGDSGMPIFEILFFNILVSFATFGFAKPAGEPWSHTFRMHRPHLVFARALTGLAGSLTGAYAFTTLPLAEAYSLIFLLPAFATILSIPILGDHVGWRRSLAIALGFAGVLLVVRPGFRELHWGHLSAATAAFVGALSMITLRVLGPTERRTSLLAVLYLTNLAVDGFFMLFNFHVPTMTQVGLSLVGGLCAGFGQISMLVATRNAPPSRVAPTQYSQMIWAVVFGAAFFGELPDVVAFGGMALIVVSGLFTLLREEQLYGWSRRTWLMRNGP